MNERNLIMKKVCVDHIGNEFESMKAMCEHWNISVSAYESRINKYHWDLERALTTPVKETKDVYGNEFKNNKEMCEAYHVSVNTFKDRLRNGKSMIEALGIIPVLDRNIENYKFDEHLTILKAVNNEAKPSYVPKYFACLFDGNEVMLPYKWIIQHCMGNLPVEKNPR